MLLYISRTCKGSECLIVCSLIIQFSSVQSLSHVQVFVTPMDCSKPGLPVHYQLSELAETHVHQVGDAIQSSHPLSSPSPPPSIFPSLWLFSIELVLRIR